MTPAPTAMKVPSSIPSSPAPLHAVSFIVLGAPVSANLLWRHDRGRVHLTAEARAWKASVECAARAAGLQPIEGRIAVSLIYAYRSPGRKLDLDNILKPLLDGLKAFFDDSQVVRIEADSQHDPRRPRVEVTIVPLDPSPLRLFCTEGES